MEHERRARSTGGRLAALGGALAGVLRALAGALEGGLGREPDPDGARDAAAEREPSRAALLEATLDTMDQGLIAIDADGRVSVSNRRVRELLGFPPGFLEGRPHFTELRRVQADAGEYATGDPAFRAWIGGGELVRPEPTYERVRPNGTALEVRSVPLPGGGVVRTYTDITQRKRAEAALGAAEADYRALFENAVVGIYRSSPEGRMLRSNPALARLNGYGTEREHVAAVKDIATEWYVDPTRREVFKRVLEEEGRVTDFVSEIYRHGSRERIWISETAWAIRDDAGKVVAYEGTVLDASERVRAESALAESEARLRALTDALPQMVWLFRGEDGRIAYANKRFRDYYGPIGPALEDRIAMHHPDDAARMAAIRGRAYDEGRPFEADGRLLRCDGAYRWHKLVMAPIRRDGEVVEWLGTALDIDDIVRAQEGLRETTALLQLAQEAAGAGLFDWDVAEGSANLSPESLRLVGLPADQTSAVRWSDWERIVHPDDLPAVQREAERAVSTGSTYRIEFRVPLADGGERWLLGIGRVVAGPDGLGPRIVGLNLDITERKRAEEQLRASEAALRVSEERLVLALDSGSDGLWDWDLSTGKAWLSDRWQTMLGYEPGELEGSLAIWKRLVHPDDRAEAGRRLEAHFEGRSPAYECEHRLRRKDGGWGWVLSRGKVVARDGAGRPLRIVGTHIDTTARREAERRIEHMARHDALTDLPNRALLMERLSAALAAAGDGSEAAVGLLLIDLDRFKTVNDTLGHPVGDALLREIAHRLRRAVRAEDTVARLGGDEFAIMRTTGPGADAAADAAVLAGRVVSAVAEPVTLDGGRHRVGVGASVGLALAPRDGLDADDLFRKADLALYRAKAEGRNAFRPYEPEMDAAADAQRRLELDLRGALARAEFALHYQPILDVSSGRVRCLEALLRWRHPERGLVSPDAFIPLAEETGLIMPIGEWVLREACRQAAGWPDPSLGVAVNISAVQFRDGGLVRSVASALAASGLRPDRLELEITESVLMNDGEEVATALDRLRALGVRVALDDFGTGYSSLSYLRRFPFDKIKIDRSFVAAIADPDTAAIVRAIVGLGRQLGMSITAEGVETPEQFDLVRAEGCTEVQGYLISPPVPADRIEGCLDLRARVA